MGTWFQIVLCPACKATKEIRIEQKRWRCPDCKAKHDVADTLYRRIKK